MAASLKNRLTYYIHDKNLREALEEFGRGKLIDIGCGEKPYRHLTHELGLEHVGVDYAETQHDMSNVDRVGDAYRLPSNDAEFDTALCTAVLEHLEEPEAALRECFRVLKPGGHAIYSVPFIWHLHEEPRDFYRFTKYGLAYLFNKSGFEVVDIIPLSGFWITFGQLLVYKIYGVHRGPLKYIPIIPVIGCAIQICSYLIDHVDRSPGWTWMYLVVAKKP